MPSSTSSSEPRRAGACRVAEAARWRRFVVVALSTAAGLGLAVFAFVALVDPWDALPLSPPWRRALMSGDQRLGYAALARSPAFDSVVVGASTTRLLRPETLDRVYGGSFANLSMNAATPREASRVLDLFRRSHAETRTVVIGAHLAYCGGSAPAAAVQPFPEWLYGDGRWEAYRHLYGFAAIQDAVAQALYLAGWRRARFGADGYADFLPDDALYDPERAATHLPRGPLPPHAEEDVEDGPEFAFPALVDLSAMLAGWPERTRRVVLLPPHYVGARAFPGTPEARVIAACKARITALARSVPNAQVVDFLIDSPITREGANFWDALHYRVPVADRIMADLALVARGVTKSDDFRVLNP